MRDWVAGGDSDLGFAAAPAPRRPELVEREFARDELVAVVPADHPWAREGRVSALALVEARLVVREPDSGTRRTLDDAVAGAGLPPIVPALTLASNQAIRDAVARERAPGVLSRLAIAADRDAALAAVDVAGLDLGRALTVIRRRDARLSGEQMRFLRAARVGDRTAAAGPPGGDR